MLTVLFFIKILTILIFHRGKSITTLLRFIVILVQFCIIIDKYEIRVEISMKIGLIGIGDIAKKAYLPVLSRYKDINIHLCTRNDTTRNEISTIYQLEHTYNRVEDLIQSGIQAAFVHSSTESHEQIVDILLDHHVHVFVDKPITYDGHSSKRLVDKAKEKGLLLMVGFNRRFVPPYMPLKELPNPNFIIVEKHRSHHPDDIRTFIFDDFIHVIDTLLNLFPYPIEKQIINGRQIDGKLYHVTLQLESTYGTAIGIMNRDAGINEEIVKVFSPDETRTVRNINEIIYYQGRNAVLQGRDDWEPTLHKRGFHHMTRTFINKVRNKDIEEVDYIEDLERHLIAEKIVQSLLTN